MEKPCFLCKIIYESDIPDIKEVADSRNFLAVLKEERGKPKKIIILPKKPDTYIPAFMESAEYKDLIESVSKYIHQKLGLYKARGGAALVPCERGHLFEDSSKKHMCIFIYPE